MAGQPLLGGGAKGLCAPFRVSPQTLGAWAQGGAPSPLGAGCYPYAAQVAPREGWSLPVDPRNLSGGPGTIPV